MEVELELKLHAWVGFGPVDRRGNRMLPEGTAWPGFRGGSKRVHATVRKNRLERSVRFSQVRA